MIASLLLTATLVAQAQPAPSTPQAQPPIGSQTQTDQTVPVPKGTRIDLTHCSGDIVVKAWDRDSVRVRATHSRRTRVRAELSGQTLVIDSDASAGRGMADYELTVPAWIALRAEGQGCFIDVEGVSGNVNVETVHGDVTLRALTGSAVARSIEGTVTLEGTRGRMEVSTVDGDIIIRKSQGEIAAESVDGSITIEDSQPTALEVSSVDGSIAFSGSLQASGRYLFTTHDGDIELALPENTSATFGVRTFGSNRVDSALPLKQSAAPTRGRRAVYTLGGGAAQVEVQSFEGSFRIRKSAP